MKSFLIAGIKIVCVPDDLRRFHESVMKLVYFLSPLQTHHTAIKEMNVMCYNFLWNDKGDKIKRKVMMNDYSEGGFK